MAITEEQFDKLENGDTLVLAVKYGDTYSIHKGVVKINKGDKFDWGSIDPSCGYNLKPEFGGVKLTIIEHIKKPVPDWHNAKVIKVTTRFDDDYYYLKDNNGNFISVNGSIYIVDDFDDLTPEVVVPGD